MARATCRCCDNEYNLNQDNTVRYHLAADPECHESPDSRKCRGANKPPAGAETVAAPETGAGYVCRVPAGPEGCGRPVQLHLSGRARSHLDSQDKPCGGGSDWPLWHDGRGGYTDHAPPAPADDEPEPVRQLRLAGALDLPHDRGADPHAREADIAIAEVERIRREEDTAYETAVQDGLREVRQLREARSVLAGDGRTAEQQAGMDRRREDPVGSALASLNIPADPVECACSLTWRTVEAMRAAGHDDMDCDSSPMLHPGAPQPGAGELFDVTHRFTDASGVEWIHPGPVHWCALPECCTHPQGFVYVDDDNGRCGDFCTVCGAPQPEPSPGDWRTPAHLIADMDPEVQELAATDPECWDCAHEVTPRAERFGPDSRITHVVWECREGTACRAHETIRACRPQRPEEDRLGNLGEGALFRRHTARSPLSGLIFKVQKIHAGAVESIVVSAGQYGGRHGMLTDITEEITCVDTSGNARARRDLPQAPGSGAISPSSPAPQPPTPSAPAPTTPGTGTDRSSTPSSTASAPGNRATSGGSSRRATSSGRTAKAGTSTASVPMTDAFSTPKQTVSESDKYDRFGRYKLHHPSDPKKKVAWTRATTFAKSVQDTFALSQWAQRMTLKGASLRPDIVAAAGTLEVKADRNQMNALVDDAKKAAGDKVAANLGTAVHTYTERRDKGEEVDIPEEHRPTVDAYTRVLADFGLEPVPGLIEFTTAVIQFEIAGTSDRCYRVTRDITIDLNGRPVTLYAGEYVIGDVKTGADLSYGWQEIAIQLSIYAQGLNASGVWDWSTGVWLRPTDPDQPDVQIQVRTDVGIVPHLPVDRERTGAPLATLYAVDLTAGWAACILCNQVRDWRKESKLAVPLTVADVADENGVSDSRFADWVTRAENPGAARRGAPAAASGPPAAPDRAEVTGRPPTLQERAQAVRNRAEASAVFQAATAAKVTRKELDQLVEIMKRKLESHVEQGA